MNLQKLREDCLLAVDDPTVDHRENARLLLAEVQKLHQLMGLDREPTPPWPSQRRTIQRRALRLARHDQKAVRRLARDCLRLLKLTRR